MTLNYAVVAIFAVALIIMAIGSRMRTKGYEDFNLAGRRVGLARLVGTLGAAEFNTATLIGAAGVSYLYGTVGIWYTSIVFIVVFGTYAFTVAKPYRRLEVTTIAEYFERRFSGPLAEPTRALASFLTLAFTWLGPATYLAGLTVVVSVMLDIDPTIAIVIITVFCLVLALAGGLMTAIGFDVVAYAMILIFVPILFVISYNNAGGFESLSTVFDPEFLSFEPVWDIEQYGFAAVLTWGFQTTLLYIAAPWYGQRVFSAKNEKVAFTAMIINTVLLFVLYGLVAMTTMFARVLIPGLDNPEEALPQLIVEYAPPLIQALLLVMLLLVGTSTIMAIWNSAVSVVVNDFVRRYFVKDKSDGFYIRLSRIIFIVLGASTLLFAFSIVGNILIVLTYLTTSTALLAFPILAGLYWRKFTTAAAMFSLVAAIIYAGIGLVMGFPYHLIGPIAVLISGVVGVVVTYVGPKHEDSAKVDEFFRITRSRTISRSETSL